MKVCFVYILVWLSLTGSALADYKRNEAVPVDKVQFGQVTSVRHISEYELINDRNQGWKVFGGALIGGALGNQFGSGSGRAITTVLGALIGGNLAKDNHPRTREVELRLIELMLTINDGNEYLVIQDFDPNMAFHAKDKIRLIYLADGSVRVDRQF